ncbi:MAG: dihydroorotate dehydrogenase (quinone), partial [Microcella sp.]|nr:dihydroorotate dehydrogenase (quinone) [Microcella sp.]
MYELFFRTLLRRIDPERAHHLAVWVIRTIPALGLTALVRRFTRPEPSLAVDTLDLHFESPFGMAAGFDKDARSIRGLWALGFGHIEIGTVTAIAQDGNPKPRLFRLVDDRAVINRMGFNNEGLEAFAGRLARRRGGVVGANIGANKDSADRIGDYVTGLRRL